jgi:cell division protein FtsB
MSEKYEAIMNCINEKLKSDTEMLRIYRDKVAELEKENAELKKENAELKEKIEDLTF